MVAAAVSATRLTTKERDEIAGLLGDTAMRARQIGGWPIFDGVPIAHATDATPSRTD